MSAVIEQFDIDPSREGYIPILACLTCGKRNLLRKEALCTQDRCYHLDNEKSLREVGERITGTVGVQLGVFNELRKIKTVNALEEAKQALREEWDKLKKQAGEVKDNFRKLFGKGKGTQQK